MNPGHVYILINEAMPGLVKIGRTSRDVDVRASELWQTGVPHKFEVFWSCKTPDCVQLEAYMHGDLRERRVNQGREFFQVEPAEARDKLRDWAMVQASGFVHGNFEGIAVVPYERWVNEEHMERLASEARCDVRTIADALGEVSYEELHAAIARTLSARTGGTK